jgi:lipopolysaccharide export system permease protein
MRLLDRYLLRELVIPLGYCLCGFLLFWVCFDLFAELADFQKKRLLAGDIAEYYLVITPEFVVLVLPVALLLALLYALTNHARYHEITAIRAAGVSLWRLCAPYLIIGFLASLGLFALNELWVPDSDEAAEQILARRLPRLPGALARNKVRDLCFNNARDGRVWRIGVYDVQKAEMTNPQVVWTLPDGTVRWLSADRADYTNGQWVFYNVAEYKEAAQTNSFPVPSFETNVTVLAYPEFTETPEQIKSEVRLSAGILVRGARKADIPVAEILAYLRLHPNLSSSDKSWLYTKLHGRLAAPWTCLVVVLIAIPFGAASGRRNLFVGVASSIFICFTYFVLLQLGLALGTGGYLPPWLAAWFPNLSFGLTGLWLTATVR